jgi:hypothetical protein
MSYELLAILVTSMIEVAFLGIVLIVAARGFREMTRVQRLITGLVIQESEKIQNLIRA